jgi:K+-sensing histidine kinase KdpD
MLDERAKAEARLVDEVFKLAPRFAARAIENKERKSWMARATPYLIGVILVQVALGFTEWFRPFAVNGIPVLFAFSLAVLAVTRWAGSLPGLFCAAASILTAKLFLIPDVFQVSTTAGVAKFYGITVGLIAIAMARPARFDRQLWRRLCRIKEAIRNTRSSSTAWPRFSSLIRNS